MLPDWGSTPLLCGRISSCAQKTSRRGEELRISFCERLWIPCFKMFFLFSSLILWYCICGCIERLRHSYDSKKNLLGRAGSWWEEVGHKWEGGGNLGRGWWGGGGGGDGQAGSQEEEELGVLTQSLLLSWVLGQPVRCPPMASWTQVFARSWSDAWEKPFGPFNFQVAFSNLELLSLAPDSSDILLQLTCDFSKLTEPNISWSIKS